MTDSRSVDPSSAKQIPILDLHELAAGKLSELFDRDARRDVFDACKILKWEGLKRTLLRFGFVVFGAISRRDWRKIKLGDVRADPMETERNLVPLLRNAVAPEQRHIAEWIERQVFECRDLLSALIPLKAHEIEFLTHLNDHGEILPELLTDDAELQGIVRFHPGLLWKALNVR